MDPRVVAAANPALVRSRIRSCSNWPSAPMTSVRCGRGAKAIQPPHHEHIPIAQILRRQRPNRDPRPSRRKPRAAIAGSGSNSIVASVMRQFRYPRRLEKTAPCGASPWPRSHGRIPGPAVRRGGSAIGRRTGRARRPLHFAGQTLAHTPVKQRQFGVDRSRQAQAACVISIPGAHSLFANHEWRMTGWSLNPRMYWSC